MGYGEIVDLEGFYCKVLCSSLQEMENILTIPQGSAVEPSDEEGKFWSHNACLGSCPISTTKQQ